MKDTPEGDEPIELVVPGEYYFRNGSHYLRYEEMMEDHGDTTINYIKISPKGMEVRKKGQVNTHMVFDAGQTEHGSLHHTVRNPGNGNFRHQSGTEGK